MINEHQKCLLSVSNMKVLRPSNPLKQDYNCFPIDNIQQELRQESSERSQAS